MNKYASPGGAQIMTMDEINHCQAKPARGALKGMLLAKKDEYGSTPSRPNSCTTDNLR
jgi:hypothetical protein